MRKKDCGDNESIRERRVKRVPVNYDVDPLKLIAKTPVKTAFFPHRMERLPEVAPARGRSSSFSKLPVKKVLQDVKSFLRPKRKNTPPEPAM